MTTKSLTQMSCEVARIIGWKWGASVKCDTPISTVYCWYDTNGNEQVCLPDWEHSVDALLAGPVEWLAEQYEFCHICFGHSMCILSCGAVHRIRIDYDDSIPDPVHRKADALLRACHAAMKKEADDEGK